MKAFDGSEDPTKVNGTETPTEAVYSDVTGGVEKAKQAPFAHLLSIPPKKMAMIAGGAAILGASSFFGYRFLHPTFASNAIPSSVSSPNNGVIQPDSTSKENSPSNSDSLSTQTQPEITKEVAPASNPVKETILPDKENIGVAENISDSMSFADAFETARQEVGIGGLFYWQGNPYNTFLREEWQSMSIQGREDYLKIIGYKPFVATLEKADNDTSETPATSNDSVHTELAQANEKTISFKVGENPAIAIDKDLDGNADIILVMKDDGMIYGMIDAKEEQSLETYVVYDAQSNTVLKTGVLDKPFFATMTDLEEEGIANDILTDENESDFESEKMEENEQEHNEDDIDNELDMSDFI